MLRFCKCTESNCSRLVLLSLVSCHLLFGRTEWFRLSLVRLGDCDPIGRLFCKINRPQPGYYKNRPLTLQLSIFFLIIIKSMFYLKYYTCFQLLTFSYLRRRYFFILHFCKRFNSIQSIYFTVMTHEYTFFEMVLIYEKSLTIFYHLQIAKCSFTVTVVLQRVLKQI